MNTKDKDELRIAAIEFKKSLGYISDYKDKINWVSF